MANKEMKSRGIGSIALDRITGQANAGMQQFLQVATTKATTVDFWALTAVGADAVISQLTNDDDTSGLGYLSNGKAYQNILYTGRFKAIKLTSGVVKLEVVI